MILRETLTRHWWRLQDDLFPAAKEDPGPLSEKHKSLVVVLEPDCVELFVPYVHGLVGPAFGGTRGPGASLYHQGCFQPLDDTVADGFVEGR